jgi:ribonucleoside-diphosphate reductase alpha chain
VLIREEDREFPEHLPVQPRPELQQGTTYKVRTPMTRDALYITINDIEEGGRRRPYEIFINTKNLQHFSWIVAMTRLISAVFRREPDPSFLVEELCSIHDPNGGYFRDGEYVPSLAAEIGKLIEGHLRRLGLLSTEGADPPGDGNDGSAKSALGGGGAGFCPMCNQPGLVMAEGCLTCRTCGYSKCG